MSLATAPPLVDLDGVSRTYPGPVPVVALAPCSLRIERGDYVAIQGPSGSGKTTLLNVLGLLDAPSGGHYRLGGLDTGSLSQDRRAALRATWIGFVFQAFYLLAHRPAVDNVVLGMVYGATPRAERRARSEAALEAVGLSHRSRALPRTMSGGEQQRVAIARAIVNRPPLLLCDEPTGNLDTSNSDAVLDLLEGLHADGHTVVVITHNPAVADRAARCIEVRDGIVVERGSS